MVLQRKMTIHIYVMDRTCIILFSFAAIFHHHVVPGLANITNDQSALLALKSHISPSLDSILATNWSTATPICSWIGVTCGSRHHRITALNISGLQLSGTIPPHLGNLSFLSSLDMSKNTFYGKVPNEFVHLRRLKVLNLRSNNFSGPIPRFFSFLTQLRILHLSVNSFSGTIPSSLSNISRLEELRLSRNYLEGSIHQEFGNLQHLTFLALENNLLTGLIPPAIFNISSLQTITLLGNKLTGKLPVDICNHVPKLEALALGLNHLEGPIPSGIGKCSMLQYLDISENHLSGSIPQEIRNLTMLKSLILGQNYLEGEIPEEIGDLQNLKVFGLEFNYLNGSIPYSLFNISTLQAIGCTQNRLSGNLPSSLGHGMHNIRELFLGGNNLTGVIPDSISNASKLEFLSLPNNKFSGVVPHSLGYLARFRRLNIGGNMFQHESSSSELSFLTSLTKCRNLEALWIDGNPFGGVLPSSLGNFSESLNRFLASGCKLKGEIPEEIGRLSNLTFLGLSDNELTGIIPTTIRGLKSIQEFYIDNNNITGPISDAFCDLKNLGALDLSGNDIYGNLPECLGSSTSIRHLRLASNRISSLPASLWNLHDLLTLNASSNQLSGHLPPEIGNLNVVIVIDLSVNNLSGNIPKTIGELQDLNNLSFSHNRLEGYIPESIGKLVALNTLDLSYNNLIGVIPKSLEHLVYLNHFNVSFNNLSGEIPNGGPFMNFTSLSFFSNYALCGASRFQVQPCHDTSRLRRKRAYLTVSIICTVVVVVLASILGFVFIRWHRKKKKAPSQIDSIPAMIHQRISYHELQRATNGFSESNLLGKGSFGTVYRGYLSDGTLVAVKIFDARSERAAKSFDIECEALCGLRHRNLTKVITSCSNDDFKSLVLTYMPNGSLEKWLYSDNYFLNIFQRLDIMIDVACALDYLHNGNITPLVHCDLKPSNILLDENMVGHVCDFGIAKLLGGENCVTHTKTLATIGYIAPEYGLEGLVSTKCDIYSFGVMVMETFSRVKPSDDMFNEELSLRSWISDSVPSSIIHVIDANLLNTEEEHFDGKIQCLISIMELALHCTTTSPEERLDVKDVLSTLQKIKTRLYL